MIEPRDIAAIEANLFPHMRAIVRGHLQFPWHRDQLQNATAWQPRSSQALAVDFFGTVQTLASRDAILTCWISALGLPLGGPWTIELESLVPRQVMEMDAQTIELAEQKSVSFPGSTFFLQAKA
jgi:hypothetical protein